MRRRKPNTPCANCQRLQKRLGTFQTEIAQLQQTVQQLQQQLAAARKDSSISSKPPSSDIVKSNPPPTSDGTPRPAGGQFGHPRHERALVPAEQLTTPPVSHHLEICPDCGHGLQATVTPPRVVQQLDIMTMPLTAVEHRAVAGWCPHCQ